MPETSTALCTVAYCPRPSDPDYHRCVICLNPEGQHHHVEGRVGTRKMKKKSVVFLCQQHHDYLSLNEWHDLVIYEGESQQPSLYVVQDHQGESIVERKLSSPQEDENAGQGANLPDAMPSGLNAAEEAASEDVVLGSGSILPVSPAALNREDWTAQALALYEDDDLVTEYHNFWAAAGILKLEAFRRIEAFRLKYMGVYGDKWVDGGAEAFGLARSTLYSYARAWRAFEKQAGQAGSEISDSYREMGGGMWELIARQPEDAWPAMSELALSVVAESGSARGVQARVYAKAIEEGVAPPPATVWRCPDCGVVKKMSEFRVIEEETCQKTP